MNSSETSPKLPMWVFFVADATLVGTAALIAAKSGERLSPAAMWAIVACVFAGAIVGLVPLLLRFERQKNETLDDRQRALEALAQTVGSSAEQISVAASGLHGIVELVQKNLKHAEQLPHKLQDKVAEFQAQLANVSDAEKEEMEKELVALRSSEAERLESVADKIAKAVAELAKLEAASRQHLAGANDATAKLALGTASAIGKAQAAAEQALGQARTEAARAIGEATGQGTRAIETARAAALADFDAHLTRQLAALDEKISRLEAVLRQAPASAPAGTPSSSPATTESEPAGAAESPPSPEASAIAPRRPRKPRREEPAPADTATTEPPAEAADSGDAARANGALSSDPIASNGSHPEPAPPTPEPAPLAAGHIPEVVPVAPPTAAPFVLPPSAGQSASPIVVASAPAAVEEPPAEAPRKRAPRKPAAETPAEPTLGLDLEDSPRTSAGTVESTSLTSDGATRLLVTAYIGIGNRLFIRGEGPGLSWEKGVPLQFISIGKWRWETNDAGGPVRFKLFKNDESECTALGAQSVEVGHQQEVTAAF